MNPCKKARMGALSRGVFEELALREMKGGIREWVPKPGFLGVNSSLPGGQGMSGVDSMEG